jgi:hypothetical protein
MNKEIEEIQKELNILKKEKDKIEHKYNEKKAELFHLINNFVGNGPEMFVNIPDSVPLSPEIIKNYVLGKYPEGTITNIDFEKRLVRLFIPAEFQRFSYESEYGKIERRVTRGKAYVDIDVLRMIDEDIWSKVTKTETILDEDELSKFLNDDDTRDVIQNALKTTRPKTSLYVTEKVEEE